MATREFFPRTMRAAIRQRTRWVTGIVLQTWERHGWQGSAVQKYWLWRDRKGLIGNPISLLTNVVFLYGTARWWCGVPLAETPMVQVGGLFGLYRLVFRMLCVGRVYGPALALTAFLRLLVGNCINSAASFLALHQFLTAKWKDVPLVWLKTDHAYPSQAALAPPPMRLGDLLASNGYITPAQLEDALRSKPPDLRLGEHLVRLGMLDEKSLYEGLSLQRSIPQSRVEPATVTRAIARSLPAQVAARNKLVPVRVDVGKLLIAGPELPTPELREELERFTSLEVEFHLVTPTNYEELTSALLPA
jgi:adsorption protein B